MTMPNTAPAFAIPAGADPMEALLRETERRAHQHGWDAGNNYHALLWSPALQGLSVAEVSNLSDLARYTHPVVILRLMAQLVAQPGRSLPTDGLVGIAQSRERSAELDVLRGDLQRALISSPWSAP